MKNTMKKLLCMALAIMLLVSAVPVFAAAVDFNNQYLTFVYKLADGTQVSSYTSTDPWTKSFTDAEIEQGAHSFVPSGYDYVAIAGPEATATNVTYTVTVARHVEESVAIVIRLIVENGGTYDYNVGQVPVGSASTTMTKADAIVKLAGRGSEYEITTTVATASTSDSQYVYPFSATVKSTSTGTITAVYSVDGGAGVEKKISADSKTVAELIALGGYSAYEFDKAGLGGTGASKGLNDTITAGQKVYIKMKTPSNTGNSGNSRINFAIKVDSSSNIVYEGGKVPANGSSAQISALIGNLWNSSWKNNYTFDYAWSSKNQTKITDADATVYVGDTVTVMLKTKAQTGILNLIVNVNDSLYKSWAIADFTEDTINNVLKSKLGSTWADTYSYNNTVVGGITYNNVDVTVKAGQTATVSLSRKYSKDNSNCVYLHVYLNGDASTIRLTKDITGTYLMDDWTTDTTEILNYLKNNYYTAKDSSNAVTIDGLYVTKNGTGTFPTNYYADNKVGSLSRINDLLEEGYVHISVMLKNATAKSSSTADSSNYKTGDTIYAPIMIMGTSVAALAAVYFIGKKRFAR